MAGETRIRDDGVAGALTADLGVGALTMTSDGLIDLRVVNPGEAVALSIYRRNASGRVTRRECVWVTAHDAASPTATIRRGQEGTDDLAWLVGDRWEHAVNVADLIDLDAKLVATTNLALSGLAAIDGVTPLAGWRILAVGQTTPSQNGPWLASAGAWSRPPDFPTGQVVVGRTVSIGAGTKKGSIYVLDTAAAVTVDTTAQVWTLVGSGTYAQTQTPGVAATAYQVGGTDVPVADGGTGGSTAAVARTNLGAGAGGAGSYALTDFGAVDLTGAVSASAVLDAALAFMYAAGGGTLVFPRGTILLASQHILPNNGGGGGGSGAQKQPPMVWQGQGAHASGQNESGSGGTRLICTFDGATYNDAKFVTRGLGQWTITGITFQDTTALADTPFIFTTNTTIKASRNAFIGATAGVTCQQDVFVLGGTTKPIASGYDAPDSAFQGYGTVIRENYFNNVRRFVYGRSYCNHTQIVFNYGDKGTGSNLVNGAPIEYDGSLDPSAVAVAGDTCQNNVVIGNYLHGIGYYYGVKLTKASRTNVIGNGVIDVGVNLVGVVRANGVTVSAVNYPTVGTVVMGNSCQTDVMLVEDALSAGRNFLMTPSFTEPAQLGSRIKMPLDAQLVIDTPAAGVAQFRISDATRDYLKLDNAQAGTWTVTGPVNLNGNTTGAATTTLTIGNNSTPHVALINLKAPAGQQNRLQFSGGGTNLWTLYDAASAFLFLRNEANGVMAMTFTPGAGVTGLLTVGHGLKVDGNVGLFGKAATAQPARAGQLTDASGGTSGGSTIAAVTDIATAANAIATIAGCGGR